MWAACCLGGGYFGNSYFGGAFFGHGFFSDTPGDDGSGLGSVLTAQSIRDLVSLDLDDQGVRFSTTVFLRQLTRAQHWVALRYRLLRTTFPLDTVAQVPWYALSCAAPTLVIVTHVARSDGTTLLPVDLAHLRYLDPAWAVTAGTPLNFYRLGWRYLGLRPVPTTTETLRVTGLVLPGPLTALTQNMEIPSSYVPQLVLVVTGLLILSQERRYQEGIRRIREGLGLAPQAGQVTAPLAAQSTL